jgi:hypothetical protein
MGVVKISQIAFNGASLLRSTEWQTSGQPKGTGTGSTAARSSHQEGNCGEIEPFGQTVKTHVHHMLRKLGAPDRLGIVARYELEGLS